MHEFPELTGKVCLITGATSGIGLEAARILVRLNATVLFAGRSADRVKQAHHLFEKENPHARVRSFLADLSNQEEVRRLAGEVKTETDRIDVLINNAGAILGRRRLTKDGLEMTWALNHLAYFLLTHELLDLLKASAPARIINVSSNAHRFGRLRFDDLQAEKGYVEWTAYAQSKLANILFTYELADRLDGAGVTANCMHPGWVATRFGNEGSFWLRWMNHLGSPLQISADRGADTLVYLAASPAVERITGRYFYKRQDIDSSDRSYDPEDRARLWEISEQQTGIRTAPVTP